MFSFPKLQYMWLLSVKLDSNLAFWPASHLSLSEASVFIIVFCAMSESSSWHPHNGIEFFPYSSIWEKIILHSLLRMPFTDKLCLIRAEGRTALFTYR